MREEKEEYRTSEVRKEKPVLEILSLFKPEYEDICLKERYLRYLKSIDR